MRRGRYRRDVRTRMMPWKSSSHNGAPWPACRSAFFVTSRPDEGHVQDRLHPRGADASERAEKLTELRDAIREATPRDSVADDRSLRVNAAAEGLNPLRAARESIDASRDRLGEWHANRPPKAAHHHELYARIAVDLARAIQGFIRAPRSDARGIDKISLAGADQLMQALYGVPMSSDYLESKLQDWQDRHLRDRRLRKPRP